MYVLPHIIDHKIDGSKFMSLDASHLHIMEISISDALFILSLKTSIVQCYQVNAIYKEAKNVKGIRCAVYKCAEEHQAYYSSLDRSKSIWYDNESADLHITLWFKEESKANELHCSLGTWHLRNPLVKSGDLIVEEKIEEFLVEAGELSKVLLCHYNAGDSESPVGSLKEFHGCPSSVDSTVSLSGHFAQLQSIEDMSTFTLCKPYSCHIKPRRFKALENDENNKLAASWTPFHQCYDGLKTEDTKTGHLNLPLLALNPLEDIEIKEEMVGSPPIKRRRVEIEVEYRSTEVAESIQLKEGSTKISDLKWKTFVHVEDPKTLCECLKWKYNDTIKKWKEADKFDEDSMNR